MGLAFAAVRNFYGIEPAVDSAINRLNVARDFERNLIQPPATPNKINNVTIFPKDEDGKIYLTFDRIYDTRRPNDPADRSKGTVANVIRWSFEVTEPYKPAAVQASDPAKLPTLTIREYLADVQEKYPDAQISYSYAWYYEPAKMYALGAGVGLVLVGGIWPSIVGLMTGAGIWGPRRRASSEDDAYLAQFGKGGDEPTVTTATVPADDGKMDDLEAAMLAKLDGFGSGDGQRESDSIDEEVEVRKLTGGALETPEETEAREAEEKRQYQGDFYPVARPGGKKDE